MDNNDFKDKLLKIQEYIQGLKINEDLFNEDLFSDYTLNVNDYIPETPTINVRNLNTAQNEIKNFKTEAIEKGEEIVNLQERLVKQSQQALKLQETEIDYLKSMNEDTSKIVNLIKNLESVNAANGKIIEANMLEIEKTLENLVNNTDDESIYELFINEVKKQIIENGVSFGLQFMFTGLKTLITKEP